MESTHSLASQELLGVVRGVRNRYRAKLALRGAAIAVAGTWVTLALATYAANSLKYSDNARPRRAGRSPRSSRSG